MSKIFFKDLFKSKEAKRLEEERLTEQRLEESRLAEEQRLEEERLAAEQRLEDERLSEEQRLKEERLAEKKRKEEEEKLEEVKKKRGAFLCNLLKIQSTTSGFVNFFENSIIISSDPDEFVYNNYDLIPTMTISNYPNDIGSAAWDTGEGYLFLVIDSMSESTKDVNCLFVKEDYSILKTNIIEFMKCRDEIYTFDELHKNIKTLFINFIEQKGVNFLLNKKLLEYFERRYFALLFRKDIYGEPIFHIFTDGLENLEKDDLEDYNEIDQNDVENMYGDIKKFHELLNKKYYSKEVPLIFTWELLIKYSVEVFGNLFIVSFSSFFNNFDKDSSIEDYISQYLLIDEISFNPLSIGSISIFTYYIMSIEIITETFGNSLFRNYNYLRDLIIKKHSENEENEFEQSLLSPKQYNLQSDITIDDIDLLSGYEFEEFLSKLFNKLGYSSHLTPKSGDQGIDLVVEKNQRKYGVQVKCFSSKVSNSAIQEVVAGIGHYNCDKGIVITNNYFTQSAIDLARTNSVILWDRDTLIKKMNEVC